MKKEDKDPEKTEKKEQKEQKVEEVKYDPYYEIKKSLVLLEKASNEKDIK